MKQERWEIRSTDFFFFLWNQKNKGLFTLSGINQSSAIAKKMRWIFFYNSKMSSNLMDPFNPSNLYLAQFYPVSLLTFFFFSCTYTLFPHPKCFCLKCNMAFLFSLIPLPSPCILPVQSQANSVLSFT